MTGAEQARALDRSLTALRLELPAEVADHHEAIVRDALSAAEAEHLFACETLAVTVEKLREALDDATKWRRQAGREGVRANDAEAALREARAALRGLRFAIRSMTTDGEPTELSANVELALTKADAVLARAGDEDDRV